MHHYRILHDGVDAGHINFRVGSTPHVLTVAGHVGYGVHPEFRGKSLSYHACMALQPFIRTLFSQVVLTADPNNAASLAVIGKLGAQYLGEVDVPPEDPAHAAGARRKKRFTWVVAPGE
ncbi:MAG: GNAT family N-acetyltransferase [Proteobacteria bacterium]|nr:GNAT family N-acetyltransferase [Pseudomonadota bacterium]